MQKKFQRRAENFFCIRCGAECCGDGYTNHCPHCLWSLHCDVYPGDRAHTCRGAMRPIALERKHGRYIIMHRCETCGFEKRNRSDPADNFDALLSLIHGRGAE